MRLKDKVAIVTGGSSGIGEATVKDMIVEGAKVVIADIDDDKGQSLANELDDAIYIRTDVTDEQAVENLIEETVEQFGKLDIVFNNAGVGGMYPSHQMPFKNWQRVIDINLTGVFLVAQKAIEVMLESGGGSIVNCASILGNVGQAQTAHYTAAKAGVINMTRSLAAEYATEGIRVNSVSPGYIDTPLLSELEDEMRQHLISLHPISRLGKPEEIAKAATFLASDDASFITGADLLVDGGYTAV